MSGYLLSCSERWMCNRLFWDGSDITHHGQRHDACQVLLRQSDLRLSLLCGGATGRVLHLPGHPTAAQRLWKAFYFQIHLEHPLNSHLRPVRAQKKQCQGIVRQMAGREFGNDKVCVDVCVCVCSCELMQPSACYNDDKRLRKDSVAEICDILPAKILQNVKSLCSTLWSTLCFLG